MAHRHTIEAQTNRLDSHLESIQQESQQSSQRHDDVLNEIQSRLDKVDRRVLAGNNLIHKMVMKARKTWFLQLGQELKALLLQTVAMNLVIYTSVEMIQSSILDLRQALPTSTSLTTPLSHERVFYLKDAIGRVSTIPLNFITSYEAFTALLKVRFTNMPGFKKTMNWEYTLQNRATGKDVDIVQHWDSVFLPGLWFDMSMVFQKLRDEGSDDSFVDTCLRCDENSNQPHGLKIKW